MSNDDVYINSKACDFFDKEMSLNKVLRDTLVSFEEVLSIKKNIRSMYNTDDPEKIKKLIGRSINNILVSEKDYIYSLLILNTYNGLYNKCKVLLEEKEVI